MCAPMHAHICPRWHQVPTCPILFLTPWQEFTCFSAGPAASIPQKSSHCHSLQCLLIDECGNAYNSLYGSWDPNSAPCPCAARTLNCWAVFPATLQPFDIVTQCFHPQSSPSKTAQPNHIHTHTHFTTEGPQMSSLTLLYPQSFLRQGLSKSSRLIFPQLPTS